MRPVDPLDRTDLAHAIGFAEPHIRAALGQLPSGFGFHDVVDLLISGAARLWVSKSSAAITHDLAYPRGKVRIIWLAGGELSDLLNMETEIAQDARAAGCIAVEINGRPGWKPSLLLKGYQPSHFSFIRVLDSDDGQEQQRSA